MWYLGGFACLVVGVATQTGPYAWMARWQVRNLGRNTEMGSFLPGFGVLLLPLLVLACLPRRADWPFIAGAKEAFWPSEATRRRTVPVSTKLRSMRRARGIAAGLTMAALLAGGVLAWLSLRPGEQAPGTTLPSLTLAEAMAPGTKLPGYAHLAGAIPRPDQAWEHDYAIRTTRYRDVYIPLTPPGWQPGDTVAVLQLDNGSVAGVPGPAEGSLARGLPGWLAAAMRDAGLHVADTPVVLTRQQLDGTVPEPDGIDALVALIVGGAFATASGAMAFSFHRAYRRLLAGQVAPSKPR